MPERRSRPPRDPDDRPRRRRPDDEPADRPVWPVFALAIGGALSLVAVAILALSFALQRPPDDPEQPSGVVVRTTQGQQGLPDRRGVKPGGGDPEGVDWPQVGATARVGDVAVDALWASPQTITGERLGEKVTYGTLTAVKLRFRNLSRTKPARFGGWDQEFEAADEHGNRYRTGGSFGPGFAIDKRPEIGPAETKLEDVGCVTTLLVASKATFEPGRSYTMFLFHEKTVAATKEVRLIVDAKELGGEGLLRFRMPIRQPRDQ